MPCTELFRRGWSFSGRPTCIQLVLRCLRPVYFLGLGPGQHRSGDFFLGPGQHQMGDFQLVKMRLRRSMGLSMSQPHMKRHLGALKQENGKKPCARNGRRCLRIIRLTLSKELQHFRLRPFQHFRQSPESERLMQGAPKTPNHPLLRAPCALQPYSFQAFACSSSVLICSHLVDFIS